MLRLLFLSAGASVGALRFESVTPLVVKSGTTINLFGIELDDIITLNDEMENVLMPGFEINLNQTSDMYKINCDVDDPDGLAEGDFEIEVKVPFQPDFENDYWMSGPVSWEMNPDGTIEMSPTETIKTGLTVNFSEDYQSLTDALAELRAGR